jgi:signal peptidase I
LNQLSSENIGNNGSSDKETGIIMAILASGNCIELPATGYSMFPTLLDGYQVTVKPFPEGVLPEPGSVVVYKDNGIMVMHRLLEIADGDNGNPWAQKQFLGVAVSYKESKREHAIRTFLPPAWRYKFNNRLLRVYSIIKRLTGKGGLYIAISSSKKLPVF